MNIDNDGLVLMGSAIGAGLAVIAGIGNDCVSIDRCDDCISQ